MGFPYRMFRYGKILRHGKSSDEYGGRCRFLGRCDMENASCSVATPEKCGTYYKNLRTESLGTELPVNIL